jgi:uroporphyrinogen III methyltransferase/synthase
VRRCTLGSLIDTVEGMSPPAIVLIGPVCHESFSWFQPGPLAGRTLLVAGAEPGGPLARALVDAGARVLEGPGERVEGAADASALDEALAQLDRYRWIAFTSRSAVRHTLGRLCRGGRDLRALAACRLAAIGPSCAEELAAWNLVPDCTPERHDSRHLAETMAADDGTARGLVLHPGSEGANHPLGAALADFGYDCERVAAYRSLSRTTAMRLTEEQVDGVCLASPSSARRYAKGVDSADRSRMEAGPCPFYAIGDPTAATMRQLGLPEARIAPGQDLDSLVALIVAELG